MPVKLLILVLFFFCSSIGIQADGKGYSKPIIEALRNSFIKHGFESIQRDSSTWQKWTNPENEPTHSARVELGRQLFHDPRLSKSRMVSCARCHIPGLAGTDGLKVSHGIHGTENPHKLNTPTVYNSVFNTSHFWDGRSKSLEDQADISLGGLHEMAFDLPAAVDFFKRVPGYQESLKALYSVSFPNSLNGQEKIDQARLAYSGVLDSIARFERELLTPSDFDDLMLGNEDAINASAIEGAILFVQKRCIECHDGPGLGGRQMAEFPRYGKYPHLDKKSLYLKTDQADLKVPILRNVARTAPYFHDGSSASLKESIRWMGELQLDIKLSEEEINALESFLISLNGEFIGNKWPVLPVENSSQQASSAINEGQEPVFEFEAEAIKESNTRKPRVYIRTLPIPLQTQKGNSGQ